MTSYGGVIDQTYDLAALCEMLFGSEFIGPQLRIVRSVEQHRSTAVASCHASGKTWVSARLAMAWVLADPHALCITSAPTWSQVEKVLWGEIHAAHEQLRQRANVAHLPQMNRTEWRLSANNYLMGLSTDQGVRLQGFHGKILIILDEAAGIRDDLFESIEGIRAGGDVRLLMLGNPTVIGGKFHDAFEADAAAWNSFHISAFDTPNFRHPTENRQISIQELLLMDADELQDNRYPFLVQRWWVREKYDQWGTDSPMWASRVAGRFPGQTDDSLFHNDWLERANRPPKRSGGRLVAGLDVAGPGEDETVLAVCDGSALLDIKAWELSDPRHDVLQKLEYHGGPSAFSVVAVDVVGIGYHIATFLRDEGYPVKFVNVSTRPRDREKFDNLKAEIYWTLREKLRQDDISGLIFPKLITQLSKIRYGQTNLGKTAIERKHDAVARGVPSPDWAESFVLSQMTFYAPAAGVESAPRRIDVLDSLIVERDVLDTSRW